MNIVFLSDDFPPMSFGGAGISTFELAEGMVRVGHAVTVITTCRKKEDAGQIDYEGINLITIQSDYSPAWRAYVSVYNARVVREVEKHLEALRPDIVHVSNIHYHLSYHSLKIAKRYAKGVVFTARDVMTFNFGKLESERYLNTLDPRVFWLDRLRQAGKRYNPFLQMCIKWYLRYADRIFAISKSLRDAMEINGIHGVEVLHNGIDSAGWSVDSSELENLVEKYGLQERKIILFSGRLSSAKGGSKAVEALAEIVASVPNAVLLVLGTFDTYAESLKTYAQKNGVAEHLVFTGWVDRETIKKIYALSDVVLFPSLCLDTFGRVNIEAMVAKKPVVGTRYGGTPEIVDDGVTGYIIDPRKPEEIALRTIELLNDPEKAKRFGEAGYKRVQEKFNLEDKVKEYIVVYESLCNK